MKLNFEEEDLTEDKNADAHQQPGRDSPKLRDGQKAKSAGHS